MRYVDILDGSSKTLLVAEKKLGLNSLGWMSGTRATLRNTGSMDMPGVVFGAADGVEFGEELPEINEEAPEFVGGFGSYHAGGVVIAGFGDGSVHSIHSRIGPKILRLWGNRDDGQLIKEGEF